MTRARRGLGLALAALALGAQAPASIGSATMLPDGTIVLQLRASGPGGTVGDGRFAYPPNHPDYAMVLRHLGGIRPGETKPVPPFP
jgi:hypothetical protein